MITTVSFNDFVDAFKDHNREENFSREALMALYNYYDVLGSQWELDVIAICCDWVEYSDSDLNDLSEAYDGILSDDLTDIDLNQWAEALNDHTLVIKLDQSILFVCF